MFGGDAVVLSRGAAAAGGGGLDELCATMAVAPRMRVRMGDWLAVDGASAEQGPVRAAAKRRPRACAVRPRAPRQVRARSDAPGHQPRQAMLEPPMVGC